MPHKMKTIRSENHELSSYEINKISLSCFDDKRYILPNRMTTLAYGHKLIKSIGKEKCEIQQKEKEYDDFMTYESLGMSG